MSAKLRIAIIACAFVAIGSPARAFEFGWATPAGCPTAAFVEGEVSRIVARPWRELGGAWRRASAAISAEADGSFRLRVSIAFVNGSASERSVTAASCTEAAEAAVAILVAGIAPETASEAFASAQSASAAPGAAEGSEAPETGSLAAGSDGARAGVEEPMPLDVSTPAPGSGTPSSGSGVEPVLGAQLGADFGSLARVAPFAQLSAGIEIERFAIAAFIAATGSVDGEADITGAGARMYLLMAGASGCYAAARVNPVLWGCAGLELGSLEASGFGAAGGRDARAFWSAGFVRGALDWNITGAAAASIGLVAAAPFQRLRVVLSPEEVHRAAAVAVRPYVGFGVRFR